MRAVEILRPGQLELRCRIPPVAAHWMQKRCHVLDVQRALGEDPACGIDAPLGSLEIRAHVVPTPADIAHLPPIIEIRRHPAAVDQRIDGARTAQHAAARPIDTAAVQAGIGQGLVLPIDRGVGKRAAVADGRLDPKAPVGAAGLENQHTVAAARRQALGKHAAGGAGADDYVVKGFHVRSLVFRPCGAMPFRDSPMSFFAPLRPVAKRGRTLYGAQGMSTTVIDLPRSRAPSSIERWYVLILTCLIYAINIADRYVVSTVLEPIRLELKLSDRGVAWLTGAPLAFFYVSFGISDLVVCRSLEPPQHSCGIARDLVGLHHAMRAVAQLPGVPARTHRRGGGRSRRHAAVHGHRLGLFPAGSAPHGDDGARARRPDWCMAWRQYGRRRRASLQLACRIHRAWACPASWSASSYS